MVNNKTLSGLETLIFIEHCETEKNLRYFNHKQYKNKCFRYDAIKHFNGLLDIAEEIEFIIK